MCIYLYIFTITMFFVHNKEASKVVVGFVDLHNNINNIDDFQYDDFLTLHKIKTQITEHIDLLFECDPKIFVFIILNYLIDYVDIDIKKNPDGKYYFANNGTVILNYNCYLNYHYVYSNSNIFTIDSTNFYILFGNNNVTTFESDSLITEYCMAKSIHNQNDEYFVIKNLTNNDLNLLKIEESIKNQFSNHIDAYYFVLVDVRSNKINDCKWVIVNKEYIRRVYLFLGAFMFTHQTIH